MESASPGAEDAGAGQAASLSGLPSPSISVEMHDQETRPILAHMSSPPSGLQSPIRHHRRTPSTPREVKETLNARSEFTSDEDDGRTHHRINQYIIRDEIGRGSYGAVHLATDQFGNEYALKTFSKSRLRRRAKSNILRRGPATAHGRPARFPPRAGLDEPLAPPQYSGFAAHRNEEARDALFLIREEIAIMKKLNHPNLVQLIEVLDDPEEDSLYMVLEMCKKGVIMKVGLDEDATPYDEECCRCWFRDLILGIEYLHAQGVIHRDIKPDNLLLSEDDVLKVVDFGVSELFEVSEDMRTAKSAGSPAFLPPELCVAKHGDVDGAAADVWTMGITLFCLRYGRIPFQRQGVLEMYEAIKQERPRLPEDENPDFVDLLLKLLEKDPRERIKMDEIRLHPWVTKNGSDHLLSKEDNCSKLVDPPNALEVNRAITRKMNHLFCVMKSIHKFKALLAKKEAREGRVRSPATPEFNALDEKAKAEEIEALLRLRERVRLQASSSSSSDETNRHPHAYHHGHELVTEHEPRFLGIGTGCRDDFAMDEATPNVVADSPVAVDFNVYDRAYEAEVERIKSSPSKKATVYLTRFIKEPAAALVSRQGGKEGEDEGEFTGGDGAETPKGQSVVAGAGNLMEKLAAVAKGKAGES